jgi:hypothetical protein
MDEFATGKPGGDGEFEVLLYEFKSDLNKHLATLGPGAPIKTLKEAIAFNEAHKDREMPLFGQELFEMAEKKGPLTDAKYLAALRNCRRLSRTLGIDAVMTRHKLDALVCPTDSPAWVTDIVNGDHFVGGSSTLPAVAGYPHITVPAGFAFELPVGLASSAAPGASRRCSSWRTPSSRPPRRAGHRGFSRRRRRASSSPRSRGENSPRRRGMLGGFFQGRRGATGRIRHGATENSGF